MYSRAWTERRILRLGLSECILGLGQGEHRSG